MAKELNLENVVLETPEMGDWIMQCVYEGARYHFWITPDTRTPRPGPDGRLFKNPLPLPDGRYLHLGDAGYFRTVRLHYDRGLGAKMVPQLLAQLPELLPAAMAARATRAAQQNAVVHERRRANRMKEAGPELFALLQAVLLDPRTKIAPSDKGARLAAIITEINAE